MRSLLRFRRDDSGMALFVAMSAIALMFLLTTTAFYFASQTLFEAKLADQHDVAFQAASSGVMVAFADLRARLALLPADRTYTGNIATSTASYAATATYNPSTSPASYDCTSTGTAADGTQEVVVASFSIIPAAPASLPFASEAFYFGGTSGGSINGNGTLQGPLFLICPELVPPNTSFPMLKLGGSQKVSGGPIYIKNADFKCSAQPNPAVTVYTNGLVNGNGSETNGQTIGGFTRQPLEATATLSFAPVSFDANKSMWLAKAVMQSSDNKLGDTLTAVNEVSTVGQPSTYLNTPRALNVTGPYKVVSTSTVNAGLTINKSTGSFGLKGTTHDDFAYDSSTKTVYVEGLVFVWGGLTIGDTSNNKIAKLNYVGNGMIVCSGDITIYNDVVPSTVAPDSTHMLSLFTAGAASFPGNTTNFTGALYSIGLFSLAGNTLGLKGSFLSQGGVADTKNSLDITALGIGDWVSKDMPRPLSTSSGSGGMAGLRMSAWRRL